VNSVAVLLLALGVAVEILSVVGLISSNDCFDRLHFVGPASTLGPVLIGTSLLVHESFSVNGIKTIMVISLLLISNPVLSHATARAARIRQFGHWQALPLEEVDSD
jgi:multicomponent Na+:H+ antiporter subunit G